MTRRPVATAAIAVASVLGGAGRAHAEEGYGIVTAAVDSVPLALTITSMTANDERILLPAIATYLVGGPVVHLAHGHPGRAGLSLVLRAGAPVALGLLGAASERHTGRPGLSELGAGVLGALAGALGAMVVDWLVLSAGTDDAPAAAGTRPVMFAVGGSLAAFDGR